jgi:large subunit ribosomal protein L16
MHPAKTRMCSGKRPLEYWVYVVKPNKILYEISGIPKTVTRAAMKIATTKCLYALNLLLLYPIKI